MIQELLLGDRKISNPFSSTSPLLSTNTSIATTPPCTTTIVNLSNSGGVGGGANNGNNSNNNSNSNSNNNSESNGNNQNLRCPRCDSTNTKFCYYNNYNLTQPRHFCKTCRRYWTKGGTLRNVPIGGGCRKNKSTISSNNSSISSSSMSSKSSTSSSFLAKIKANTLTSEMLVNDHHNSLFLGNGFSDHPIHSPSPNPLPWSSLPQSQNSHILALLRGSTPFSNPNNPNPNNPNPNPNPTSNVFTSLGLDSYGNGAPSLLGSFTRNNNNHLLNGFAPNLMDSNNNENNNNGGSNIMDLYQRLKSSSTTNYGYSSSNNENNHGSLILGHMVGTTSSSSMNTSIYDAGTTPFGGGDHLGGYGLMNSSHGISSWNDFPAVPINGTYP